MISKKRISFVILGLLIAAFAAMAGFSFYYADLPNRLSQHETLVLGQTSYTPGSTAAVRVIVRDTRDGTPLGGAQIAIALRDKAGASLPLYQGQTDPQGSANASFKVPDTKTPEQTLVVETRSALGSDTVERPVTVQREYRVLLTTDKPLYQPGQTIHLRALALSAFDLKPAKAQELEVVIADGKGNKVFRKLLTTSAYGAAAVDFELASEVNTGAYKITARAGKTSSEKTVTVEQYVLPKFGVKLETGKTFYLPGETVTGTLRANYFFGKPVSGGKVLIEGYTFDVQRNVAIKIDGQTDPEGNYSFKFNLPQYLTGTELDKGSGRFYVQASVTDATQHSEAVDTSLPVSRNPLVIDLVPEGGFIRAGVENILYALVSYPDGSPAEATLSLTYGSENNEKVQASTGAYGLAEIRRTPRGAYLNVTVEARDKKGYLTSRTFTFQGERSEETILLRPEQPIYQVGDPMKLTVLTTKASGTVYLDIIREGQVVSTRAVEIKTGRGELVVDLTPELYGTLELHAYKIMRSGSIVRDTRMVVVDQAAGLNIALAPGQETYHPGDGGKLDISVTGSDGQGAQSALGLAVVDESVFALAEQDPGFAKLYFLLEKELLEPKYDLHGYSLADLLKGTLPAEEPQLNAAVGKAAQASLAAAVKQPFSFGLQVNSHQENLNKAYSLKSNFFQGMASIMTIFLAIIPLGMLLTAGYSLWKRKVLGRSLALTLIFLGIIAVLVSFWPLGKDYGWVNTFDQRLQIVFNQFFGGADWIAWLIFAAILGFIGLTLIAALRKDQELGLQQGLVPFYGAAFALWVLATSNSSTNLAWPWLVLIISGFLLAPLSYWLRFAGYTWLRQGIPALAALGVAAFLLVGLPLAVSASSSRIGKDLMGGPVMMEDAFGGAPLQRGGIVPPMAAAPMPQATMAASAAGAPVNKSLVTDKTTAAEPPRLRQYFPETMLWLADTVTGADGKLSVDVPVADSITTWRITALASTQDGRLGSATGSLRVFQDFFVDLDLPVALTVGDEIAVPVGVFNYLPSEQTVKLELAQADWFELKDQAVKEIKIASNEISVVYFRVKASQFGRQSFQVTAWGSKMSDAIRKDVTVYPDGKQITASQADRLAPGKPVVQSIRIPASAIPGTQRLVVKIYPGMLSQLVEGLDSILRMPNGCFEQTSSTTYPNVLVLDYLKTTNQAAPEAQMKAEQYINLGYQRLATFEVKSSGGFSLFGNEPADRMLTAYGLQEFSDMSRVHDVDPALLQRAARWLLSQQESDGSWKNDKGLAHENTWQSLGNDRLPVTAYIIWSLTEAGFGSEPGTQKGLAYVQENQSQAMDPYALALVANALVSADLKAGGKISPATSDALNRLAGLAQRDGDKVFWKSGVASFMGSQGLTGSIETTALASLAFQRADVQPDLANSALVYLIKQKDGFGTWHNTQATVLTLKALIQSVRGGGEKVNASVKVSLNGGQTKTVQVTPQNFDVVQLLSFDDVNPGSENRVEILTEGQGNLMYQVTSSYYLPWQDLGKYPDLVPPQDAVTIDIQYDRVQLNVNDTVKVTVTVNLNQKGARAESALVDLGLPPGFTVLSEDLDALIERYQTQAKDAGGPSVQRYDLTGRQILVYLANLAEGQPLTFSYRLRARFPLSVHSPASSAYDYYNPSVAGEKAPLAIVVNP